MDLIFGDSIVIHAKKAYHFERIFLMGSIEQKVTPLDITPETLFSRSRFFYAILYKIYSKFSVIS